MTDDAGKDRPLPRPQSTPFGRKKRYDENEEPASLLADRMAGAMAEGKLDEFMKSEMPDSEYARSLAGMMMGMTGMMPMGGALQPQRVEKPSEEQEATAEVPEDVRKAAMSGDVQGLMEKLRREHLKQSPDSTIGSPSTAAESAPSQTGSTPAIDKELIDSLIQIAKDNNVTLDWIILRAIKAYVQEYQKNGKL